MTCPPALRPRPGDGDPFPPPRPPANCPYVSTEPETQYPSHHPIPQEKAAQGEERKKKDMKTVTQSQRKPSTKNLEYKRRIMIQRKVVRYVQTSGVLEGRVAVGVPAGGRVLGGVELLGYALREEGLWLGPAKAVSAAPVSYARACAPDVAVESRVWGIGGRQGWEGQSALTCRLACCAAP